MGKFGTFFLFYFKATYIELFLHIIRLSIWESESFFINMNSVRTPVKHHFHVTGKNWEREENATNIQRAVHYFDSNLMDESVSTMG